MTIERTLSIIKPDVVGRNLIGDVIHRFENAGLTVVGAKMVHLRPEQAMRFYQEHRKKPFSWNSWITWSQALSCSWSLRETMQ